MESDPVGYRKTYKIFPTKPPEINPASFMAPMQAVIESVIKDSKYFELYINFRCELVVSDDDLEWMLPYRRHQVSQKKKDKLNRSRRATRSYTVSCMSESLPQKLTTPIEQDFGYAWLQLDTSHDNVRCVSSEKAKEISRDLGHAMELYEVISVKQARTQLKQKRGSFVNAQEPLSATSTSTAIAMSSSSNTICQDVASAEAVSGLLATLQPPLANVPPSLDDWPELPISIEEVLQEADRMKDMMTQRNLKRAEWSESTNPRPQKIRLVGTLPETMYGLGVTRVLKETGPTSQLEYRPTTDIELEYLSRVSTQGYLGALKSCITLPMFADTLPHSLEFDTQIGKIFDEDQLPNLGYDP